MDSRTIPAGEVSWQNHPKIQSPQKIRQEIPSRRPIQAIGDRKKDVPTVNILTQLPRPSIIKQMASATGIRLS